MNIKYATISKAGRRSNNKDAFKVVEVSEDKRFVGIVCDGRGGHVMGEVASETVTDAIADFWQEHTDESDGREKVAKACRKACKVLDEQSYSMGHVEMGTTMVMAGIEDNRVTIAHVGDGRCYLQRPGRGLLYQTADHVRIDFGWEIVERCFFSYRPEVAVPDVVQYELQPGDRLLLCSDGLYKGVEPDILLSSMMDNRPLADILDIYDTLCGKQGDDNYTAILIEVE